LSKTESNLKPSDSTKIFKNDTRFQIWGLLSMYHELSLSELCNKLNKSKSTVHHHLQRLLDIGIIEVVREEKVRGSIPAKIYSLRNADINDNVFVCGIGNRVCPSLITGEITGTIEDLLSQGIDEALSERVIEGEKVIETYNKNIHQSRFQYYKNLSSLDDAPTTLEKIFEREESFNSIIFLSESHYLKLRLLFNEMLEKLYKFMGESKGKKKELQKPFVFLASAMNLKEILEKNNSLI